jgi:hypothetical protein
MQLCSCLLETNGCTYYPHFFFFQNWQNSCECVLSNFTKKKIMKAVYIWIHFLYWVKSDTHCLDFHRTHNFSVNVCVHLAYPILCKSVLKIIKHWRNFTYAVEWSMAFFAPIYHERQFSSAASCGGGGNFCAKFQTGLQIIKFHVEIHLSPSG